MKNKPYLSLAVLLGGIVAIVLLIEFKTYLGEDIFWLSLFFGLTSYAFTALPFFLPFIPDGTRFHSWVGTLGIRIWGTSAYFIATCLIIVCCNLYVPHVKFAFQFSLHLIALIVMLLSLHFSDVTQTHVENVAMEEQQLASTVDGLRSRFKELAYATSLSTSLSPEVRGRLMNLCEEARFLTPIRKGEALLLENELNNKVNMLIVSVSSKGTDINLGNTLKETELLMQRRRQVRI